MRAVVALLAAGLLGAGCGGPAGGADGRAGHGAGAEGPDPEPPPARVVDSIFPVEEEIRRFQASLPERPEGLAGGASSREELVRRFVAALEAADTAALRSLVLTRSEFGYLYFPSSRFARAPYRTKPGLAWMIIRNNSATGIARALARFGGRPLGYAGHRCPQVAEVEGENRIWSGCVLLVDGPAGEPAELRLFGSIVERGGRYKLLSFENDL